jgi:hypothetical protein
MKTNIVFRHGVNPMTAYFRYNRWSFAIILGITLAPVLLTPATARAELLLATDSNAMSGWHGTSIVTASIGSFTVDVQYAVYAPGQFNLSFSGEDPSGDAQYVYAYQLFNSDTSAASIREFTVGLDGDESPANIGAVASSLGNATNSAYFAGSLPTSAVWSYVDNKLSPGSNSKILIFTSPYGPEWDSATLLGTKGSVGQAPGDGLPSPVPEPAAVLGLASIGCLFVLARLFRRKSH